ncbi:MAG: dephospho-CoA kinase [Gemmatimonadetes bacterium]|nr:dephospho-CoA kinase [Gemmatimonadota bacterium]
MGLSDGASTGKRNTRLAGTAFRPRPPNPGTPLLHVALTGNIASGKSTVAALLARRGATVIDADALAREAVAPGTPGLAAVVARFGRAIVAQDGSLDRAALRRLVFEDSAARTALEAIIHPIVQRRRAELSAAAAAAGAQVVVSDIPLLFETGLQGEFDAVIVVDAPEAVRLGRLTADRLIPDAEARAMMAAQADASAKRAAADYVIANDGAIGALDGQVEALWRALVDRASNRSP